ncbi:hypothetical protein TELCIR_08937 [Teladorsagia circumcincta]|uniref:Uncharacterized protein n=1 Tax=Teladorsagia circumcincta TaxID=45464 RepID=A0A2G9UG74_TELCI|nr:hypothetical protein TELCIR_08937 [Teladorsagia circumcincta]
MNSEPRLPDWQADIEERISYGIEAGKKRGVIWTGDPLVVVTGWHQDMNETCHRGESVTAVLVGDPTLA